jgi:aspartyl-tRNA(Asn)/glutamyl-tRNA(Gln) amidotransferase subunit A
LRAQPPATRDAAAVSKLRKAGAVIIGKTQMTEFAFSALGTNAHDGTPGNPHARDRVPGGSSSGAAVSVVDGMAEIAIGSDTGGSIRIPAALCGAVGFKPTQARMPLDGAFSLSSSLDTIGPIAATVADCAVADAVLSGDAPSPVVSAPIDGFRLTVARGQAFDACETAVGAAFDAAVSRFRAAGIRIADGSLKPHLDRLAEIDRIGTFPSIEVAATLKQLGVADLSEVDPKTRVRIEAGATIAAVEYVRMVRLRAAAVHAFDQSIGEGEVFILPTTPIRAPLLSSVGENAAFHASNGSLLRNPRIANLLDCPSISLPMQTDGLPGGLMLFGRRNSDRHLFAVAQRLERILSTV